MSKIDLSKAKVGDKFRTRGGRIATFLGRFPKSIIGLDYHVKIEQDTPSRCFVTGMWLPDEETQYDLVEQVFDDEKDRAITDKILKDAEKVVNGVAEAMPLIESAAIANLLRESLPENNEDDPELQRRQEVVELAEKMYIMFENENYRYYLSCNRSDTDCSEELMEIAIKISESFINKKHQYLKDGKL